MAGTRPILLLGASGQVGWELQRTLAPLGHPVVAVDRSKCDLSDIAGVTRLVAEVAPALVVNAAAYTAVDAAEADVSAAFAINAEAPAAMAAAARGLAAPLVHYSTDYVFDGCGIIDPISRSNRPFREDDPPAPLNAYGRSKLAGEQAVRDSGVEHLIFRTSWVYAARGRNFLLTIRRLAKEREELRVVADQIGAPTWARMIAEATAVVLARCWRPRSNSAVLSGLSGIYHLASRGSTSWHGFAEAIVAGVPPDERTVRRVVPIRTADYPTAAARPTYSLLDTRRLIEAFGVSLPDWRHQLSLCLSDLPPKESQ
jgi:dTDP-4-dehydrorhamnose reductase